MQHSVIKGMGGVIFFFVVIVIIIKEFTVERPLFDI